VQFLGKNLVEDDMRVPHVILYEDGFRGSILGSVARVNDEIWVI
jgi:hypothetical protein